MNHWQINPCCKMWIRKNSPPTICPECDTQFVITTDYEVWPLHLLSPRVEFANDADTLDGSM